MLPEISQRFSDKILTLAIARFDIAREDLKNLGGFESEVYEYQKDGKTYILKITHSIRRSVEYLIGELDFVNELAASGVSASRSVASPSGRLVEEIEDGIDGHFLVYSFEKAPGERLTPELFDADFQKRFGQLMGRMHAVASQYRPSKDHQRAAHLDEELFDFQRWIPEEQTLARQQAARILKEVKAIPQRPENYGLVHCDMHYGNYFVEAEQITVFDFDDAAYSHFANDIAIALYYFVNNHKIKWYTGSGHDFYKRFIDNFLSGYSQEFTIDDQAVKSIPLFLKNRNLLMYCVMNQVGPGHFGAEEHAKVQTRHRAVLEQDLDLLGRVL